MGVDWGDRLHQVYVGDQEGKKVREMKLQESPEGLAEIGRWLDEKRAEGFELWAAIEKPQGRIVDFLLDHGVEVYPVNPKAVDRVRDRYRMSGSKSDAFDAYVLAEFLRTDQVHLRALRPSSEKAQELKMLSRDQRRVVRHKTRFLNQLTTTLKEYYARPLEVFEDLETEIALDFLKQYPTPAHLSALTRKQFNRFATKQHHLSKQRCEELWEKLNKPQLAVPEHVVRAKAQLVEVLIEQLRASIKAVKIYNHRVESFFACSKHLRYTMYWFSFVSLNHSEWAKLYYRGQRDNGHSHHQALRALGAKWLKIIFVMWRDHKPYDENYHLANIARQKMRQAA